MVGAQLERAVDRVLQEPRCTADGRLDRLSARRRAARPPRRDFAQNDRDDPRMSRSSYFQPHIDRMAGYVPGEQPREGGFIKLNTNENPYPPSPKALEAVVAALTDR